MSKKKRPPPKLGPTGLARAIHEALIEWAERERPKEEADAEIMSFDSLETYNRERYKSVARILLAKYEVKRKEGA